MTHFSRHSYISAPTTFSARGNVYVPFALVLVASGSGEVRLVNDDAAAAIATASRFRDKVASADEQ